MVLSSNRRTPGLSTRRHGFEELVWLNVSRDSNAQVAGTTTLDFMKDYINACQLLNVQKLFSMLATEVVDTPEDTDVLVTDENIRIESNAEIIHSYDIEHILALMNT